RAFGFQDEVWFSRLAQPSLHTWAAGQPLRLGLHAAGRDEPEAKALACYGLWLPERERMLLRFVAGRPVSGVTRAFLAWVAGQLAAEGVRALVWDDAPWHVSREVRAWIGAHDRRAKRADYLLVLRPSLHTSASSPRDLPTPGTRCVRPTPATRAAKRPMFAIPSPP